ncbi:MAG: asparagine synthase (glutamine-hydrolyzing) [Spirochaetota bacterium]
MCGIVGVVERSQAVDRTRFTAMVRSLILRGPDQEGIRIEKNIALGHRRLSIIDTSVHARQPLENEDASVRIVYNGEIYNYRQVKSALTEKHRFVSASDTEVLVHGYEEYGADLVRHVEGMFAFCIHDRTREQLFLARDHFGKKPLYYYLDDERFVFASELKAMLAYPPLKKRLSVDDRAVTQFLFYGYIPSPGSIFSQIRKVPPSTAFTFDIASWRIQDMNVYWEPGAIAVNRRISMDDTVAQTETLIDAAVQKRLMADVPLGVFLSGGIDSSIVTASLARHTDKVNAFTVSYRNAPEADESAYADYAAKRLGIPLDHCYLEGAAVKPAFEAMLDYLDEPLADAAVIPLYYVAQYAKKHITVALSGDGGDELFGGYEKHRAQVFIERLSFLRWLASAAAFLFPKDNVYRKFFTMLRYPFPVRQFIFGSGGLLPADAARLLGHTIDIRSVFREAFAWFEECKGHDILNRSLYLDCRLQLPDWYLVKGDRATMAASLEMRNPLLDKDLAEFVFSLPGSMKVNDGTSKYIIKRIAEKIFGRDFAYRPKRGFGVPLDRWIRSELSDLFKQHTGTGRFSNAYARVLYDEHCSGRADHRFTLLRILQLNVWAGKYE